MTLELSIVFYYLRKVTLCITKEIDNLSRYHHKSHNMYYNVVTIILIVIKIFIEIVIIVNYTRNCAIGLKEQLPWLINLTV